MEAVQVKQLHQGQRQAGHGGHCHSEEGDRGTNSSRGKLSLNFFFLQNILSLSEIIFIMFKVALSIYTLITNMLRSLYEGNIIAWG